MYKYQTPSNTLGMGNNFSTTNSLLQSSQLVVNYGETLCHAIDDTGNTPLHLASECGNLESVKNLLNDAACAEAQNHELETPMHLAALQGMEQ